MLYPVQLLQMFCGIVDGSRCAAVLLFDLRSTAGAVRKLRAAARQRQPVHSICHTANDELVCATMGGVWAWGGGTNGSRTVGNSKSITVMVKGRRTLWRNSFKFRYGGIGEGGGGVPLTDRGRGYTRTILYHSGRKNC